MAIVILLLLCVLMLGALGMKGWRKSSFFLLACLAFLVMFLCFYIYSVKNTVFAAGQRQLIYGPEPVERFFRNVIVTRQLHAAVYCGSRAAVPVLLFLDAAQKNYYCRRLFARRRWLWAAAPLPAAAAVAAALPGVAYRYLSYCYGLQAGVSLAAYAVLLAYLLAALALHLWEYVSAPVSWYRKNYLFTLIGTAVFIAEYAFFALFDPALIYQDLLRVFVYSPFLRLYYTQSMRTWLVMLGLGVVSTSITLAYIWLASKVIYDREKLEMRITLQTQSDPVATALIIHGVKNLILQSKILSGELCEELDGDPPGLDQARACAGQLREINTEMRRKIDYLYASFQSKSLTLSPTPVPVLMSDLEARSRGSCPGWACRDLSGGAEILCDRELFGEALYNLLVNAYEAVPAGREPQVSLTVRRVRSGLLFTLHDNGRGIPPELGSRIFLPFTTSKGTGDSWGLGLCYARQIIKKHMGEISFESERSGTSFFISMPLCSKE